MPATSGGSIDRMLLDDAGLDTVQLVGALRAQLGRLGARELRDELVVVDVLPARRGAQRETDGRLARAHHPDEEDRDLAAGTAHAGENSTTTLMSSGVRSNASCARSAGTRRLIRRESHSRSPIDRASAPR